MEVSANVREATFEATVIRCTCGAPGSHTPAPCPGGISQELGVIAQYKRSWISRLLGGR